MMLLQVVKGKHLVHGSYRYQAFGLHIASDILLPQLLPGNDISVEPEVAICLGKVPSVISDVIEKKDTYQLAKNEFILRVHGVGSYYVTNGSCIIVEPDEQSEERVVSQFLLNVPLGTLLLQRGIISMHGSAVVFEGYCVVFTGEQGAGKSTLTAAFRERGFPILTDDVAALVVDDDDVFWVQPAGPQQSLRRDSAQAVGVCTPDSPVLSGGPEDKLVLPVEEGFCQSAVPLGAVYELRVGESRQVTIVRLSNVDKLKVLMNNSWGRFTNLLGLTTAHFDQCLKIAGKTHMSRLTRPKGVFSLGDQMRLVQEDLQKALLSRVI